MAVLEVLSYPNPFLRKHAEQVIHFDDALRQLVVDMTETMVAEDGVGLAATQVGRDLQLLLVHPTALDRDGDPDAPNVVVINPQLIWQSEEVALGEEGCLSFPGVFTQVKRPVAVRVSAVDLDQRPFELEGHGFGARALLHEIDHLRGVVMVDHLSYLARQRALKKLERNLADKKASTPGRRDKAAAV